MNPFGYIKQFFPFSLIGALCIFGSFTYTGSSLHGSRSEFRWTVLPNSSITISGSSNINRFGCEAGGVYRAEPLLGSLAKDGKTVDMQGAISIAVDQFDCRHRMLNNDLRKTLKADEYPHMTIRFVSLERMPLYESGQDFISGKVLIELAGQRKTFVLRYSFSKTPSGCKLEGSRAFSFADFNLSPPSKVGGMIKVKDDFDVAFTLQLNTCN